MRGGALEIENDGIFLRNGNGVNMFDDETTANQSSVFLSSGNLNFDNYADPITTAGAGNIKFRTINLSSTSPRFYTRMNINYDGVTIESPLICKNNITLTADNNLLQSGTGIISQTGSGNNTFKGTTIAGVLTVNNNIKLATTFSTPTSVQLGYKFTGTKVTPSYSVTANVVFLVASITLPVGVWNVFGQASYYIRVGGNLAGAVVSLSTMNSSIDYNCAEQSANQSGVTAGNSIIKRINSVFTSTGSTTFYLTGLLGFFSPVIMDYDATNTNISAVRIA